VLRAIGTGPIFAEKYGSNPPRVIFLHGWGRSGRDFGDVAVALAKQGVSSLALDLPGFGSSPLPAIAGGAALYAEIVEAVIALETSEPVVVVGHSFGGRVAVVLATSPTAKISGLVLTGVPLLRLGPVSRGPLAYRIIRRLGRVGLISSQQWERARQKYGSRDYRNASGLLRDILVTTVNESYETQLAELRVPVALVWGALDQDVPLEVATRAMNSLPASTSLVVLDAVGHLVPTESPGSLVVAVDEMLQ
jgi:pimeloyl-ACP methyl ester carboxylesterase